MGDYLRLWRWQIGSCVLVIAVAVAVACARTLVVVMKIQWSITSHGIPAYLLFAALVAVLSHALAALLSNAAIRRYVFATFAAAIVCGAVRFAFDIYPAIFAGKHLNLGVAPMLFSIWFDIALPICAAIGLPFLWFRRGANARSHYPSAERTD